MRTAGIEDSVRHDARGFRLLVARDYERRASAEGLTDANGFREVMATARCVPGGRGSNRILDSIGAPIRLRPSRHGGFLGNWLGDRFFSPDRPFREFRIWILLRQRGVPLPTPAFAVSQRHGLFWQSAFGSLERPKARDGAAWLETQPDTAQLRMACVALAKTLRQFHDAGALHGDLHLRNVLIEPGPDAEASVQLLLIDLDRARTVQRATALQRFRELMRFARSLEKAGRADLTSPRFQAIALSAYCAGDRKLRNSMLRWGPTESRRAQRHRMGWWFGNRFSRAVLLTAVLISGIACGDAIADQREGARWSLMATGDTGRTSLFASLFEGQLAVAQAMTEEAQQDPVDALALLGDIFYWHGLNRKHLVERIRRNLVGPYCHFLDLTGPRSSEVGDACGIGESARAPVDLFAVLGNHDIEFAESIDLQRNVIPDFLPGWHMSKSLTQVYEVAPGVSLILFESELAIDDKEAIQNALREAISEARGPWRILATHRPVATDDEGFPPVGGYPGFVREAIAESGQSVQLVLAGHHHSLQVFEIGPPTPSLHIGIGSGSRTKPPLARNHPDARFGVMKLGFARVDLVSHGDEEERLSVRLFGAPRWPWLASFQNYELLAHFEVDLLGQVSERPLR
jgi:hypothetical protein